MLRSSFTAVALLTLSLPLLLTGAGRSTKQTNNAKATAELKQQASTRMANLPIYFEPNRGQTDPSVSYMASFGSTRMFLTRDSAVFVIQKSSPSPVEKSAKSPSAPLAGPLTAPAVIRMRTVNSQRGQDEAFEKLPGISNYFIGKDSKKWVTDIPQYAKVKRTKVYPGVDMVFYGNQRQLEYDFIIAPGADPNRIELAYDGVDGIRTNANGDLVLATSAGDFIQKRPKVYQQFNGKQTEVAANYKIGTGKTVRFEVARYDHTKPLVIDPVIVFNAIVGSSGDEGALGLAIDGSMNTYVIGTTTAPDFPLVNPFNSMFPASYRIIVFKLNASGTALLYSTYIGGESNDFGQGVAVDSSGNAIITGTTTSLQYPTVAAAQGSYGGGAYDGVVSKLSASGGSLLYSTYLGGIDGDQMQAITVDTSGNAYVVGFSGPANSSSVGNFPTTGSSFTPSGSYGGGVTDCVVAKYGTAGNRIYSVYLGGNDLDICYSVAADSSGYAYVTGRTQSTNFPANPGAFQTTLNGQVAAFVTRINPTGTQLYYSTYFGGEGTDAGAGIAVDAQGFAYITGSTFSKRLPVTTGAFQTTNPSIAAAFVAKFAPSGSSLSYATYLSGSQTDGGYAIAVDSGGNAYVAGTTTSSNFPVSNAVIGTKPGATTDTAGFAASLNSSGSALNYSTFIGGPGSSNKQYARNIVLDSSANAYIIGQTDSPFYRNTAGALNAGYGGTDIFVTKLSPSGGSCFLSFGSSTLSPYGTGGSFPLEIFAPSGCGWSASANASWVSLSGASGATGSGATTVVVAANSGSARSTTIGFTTGQSITINQGPGGCSYTFNPTSGSVPTGGGSGSASLSAGSGCTWNAVSNEPWLTLFNTSGSGSGSIGFNATVNGGSLARSGLITVGTGTFTVTQASSAGSTYTGYIDSASCNGISGWAADKNRLNTSIVVTLWDGSTQIASTTANGSRGDVGALLGDNGLHAFSIPIPAGTANGVAHTLQLRYETSSTQLPGSPFVLTCGTAGGNNYTGYIDSATCNGINGWAADKNRLNTSIVVTVWDGGTQIASTTANGSRGDVGGLLGDNGLHGFSIPIPAGTANGAAHTLQIRYETSNSQLPGSPATLTCGSAGGANYTGYIDSASCSGISGWAADKNRLNTSIVVTLWDGGTQIASTTANGFRGDVGGVLGDNGLHAFSIPIPAGTANGAAHTLQIRYESSASQLPGSPATLTCGSAGGTNYTGYIDSASCSGISGWAADKNRLNTSIVVTLWDGGTQIASTTANGLRGDVGGVLGDNGLHAFSIPIPAGTANGAAHTLQIRYETSTSQLPGSPATLTCGSAGGTNYTGYIDSASCSGISGWAADKNRLNTPIVVSLWDGGTQIASTTANGSRSDVGGVLGDNGLHGFSIPIPSGTANGVAHTLQIRYETSTSQLPGSPATVTCGSSGSSNFTGYVDALSCSTFSGWAADKNALNTSITIQFFDGGTLLGSTVANISRGDVGGLLGDNGLHGFTIGTPFAIKDGNTHTINIRPVGSTVVFPGAQTVTGCH